MGQTNQLAPYSIQNDRRLEHHQSNDMSESAQLAALAMAQARDGALVDGSLLKQRIGGSAINSRHLLSEDDAAKDYDTPNTTTRRNNNATRGSDGAVRVNGMDLVLINGTWHVVDLSICQQIFSNQTSAHQNHQYFNQTHFIRINNELDGLYKRYQTRNAFWTGEGAAQFHRYSSSPSSSGASAANSNEGGKLNPKFIEDARNRANARNSQSRQNMEAVEASKVPAVPRQKNTANVKTKTNDYPISLYDTQTRKHEQFANSVRQRNDTFYFLSFRRVSDSNICIYFSYL